MAAAQEMPLGHLALVAREACVSRSNGTVTIQETILGRLPPRRDCTENRLKHIPSLSVKEAYLFVLELWLEEQASGLAHT